MARPLGRKKTLAIGLLPAAVTTVALVHGTGAAGANTITTEAAFTDGNGIARTCTINLTRTTNFGGDAQVAEGGTGVTDSDPACTDGVQTFVSADWDDPDGLLNTSQENGDGNPTLRRYGPIGAANSFVTHHRVDFEGSIAGCIADCSFTVNRSK